MKNTAKYAWLFSRNSSFLRGLFYYAAPCRLLGVLECAFAVLLALRDCRSAVVSHKCA